MKETFNYKLEKPDRTEFYNVGVQNRNMDTIDEALIGLEGKKETKVEHDKTKERVGNLEESRAFKNGSSTEDFSGKVIIGQEIKVGSGTVYHTGRKPSKSDVGLGSVDNYPSSDKHDVLDGTGNKFMLQKGIKAFYDKFVALVSRVSTIEGNRAFKNGSSTEDFNAKVIIGQEIKVGSGTVYHTGRKPSKSDVGLGSVDNYPSSDKHDVLDGTGNKFMLQKGIKAFYDKFVVLVSRVSAIEGNRAMKNGSSTEDFNGKVIIGSEVKVGTNVVYHVGRKPNKSDVGLSNVANYSSSDKHDVLDGTGNKYMLQKGVKAFYDRFVALVSRVSTIEGNRAMKNGSSTEDFNGKTIVGQEIKVGSGTVYHTGRKPNQVDVGLSNLSNYLSSDKYDILDGDGNKYALQKAMKQMYDRLKQDVENVSVIGEPVMTLCNTLPNVSDFGWCDGGQLKKSDYPNLWKRVEATVNSAAQKVTAGELQYGVNYFGWYIGDTSEYFRKPNLNTPGNFMRPSGSRFVGHFELDSFKSHNHSGQIGYGGAHSHTGTTDPDTHSHTLPTDAQDTTNYNSKRLDAGNASRGSITTSSDTHSHKFTTSTFAAHNHSLTINISGEGETKPKNVAVKYYCRIR